MSVIEIYPNTKVYVVAPANKATGGPELLHQLVFHLRNDLNVQAFMYYIPSGLSNPEHPEYKRYNNPYTNKVVDKQENLLIVPEVAYGIKFLNSFSKIRKAIWWLSVDNFYISFALSSKKNFFFRRLVNKFSKLILGKDLVDFKDLIAKSKEKFDWIIKDRNISSVDFHLAQSYYAVYHLRSKGVSEGKILYLSDYLNEDFLREKVDVSKKKDMVAFNPKKGYAFTKEIINNASDIRFVPLENMSRREVIETLKMVKVYIDFGHHPGKDRIPREAAILGCCVITGRRGAARFFEDVPIPDEYKFEDKKENIPKILSKIRDCFVNFRERYKDFDYYRQIIKSEYEKFKEDLKKIFIKV